MARWRCADRLYLVLEENIHAEAEIPGGWGLLLLRGGALAVAREAPVLEPRPDQRAALRRAIAQRLAGPPLPEPAGPDLLFAESA
jgi:hypothetical protein